jgi:hypothetical protein
LPVTIMWLVKVVVGRLERSGREGPVLRIELGPRTPEGVVVGGVEVILPGGGQR